MPLKMSVLHPAIELVSCWGVIVCTVILVMWYKLSQPLMLLVVSIIVAEEVYVTPLKTTLPQPFNVLVVTIVELIVIATALYMLSQPPIVFTVSVINVDVV